MKLTKVHLKKLIKEAMAKTPLPTTSWTGLAQALSTGNLRKMNKKQLIKDLASLSKQDLSFLSNVLTHAEFQQESSNEQQKVKALLPMISPKKTASQILSSLSSNRWDWYINNDIYKQAIDMRLNQWLSTGTSEKFENLVYSAIGSRDDDEEQREEDWLVASSELKSLANKLNAIK